MARLGLIARADLTGLSVQTHAYWRHLQPHRTLVVDLSRHSKKFPDMGMYPDATMWNDGTYPDVTPVKDPVLEEFLDNVDVVLTCETPYNYWLFERARQKGVKTVLQFNYEFLDYSNNKGLPEPDLFLAPSMWHWEDIQKQLKGRDVQFVPVPVDREMFPFRLRTGLDTLLHLGGTVAMEDRNGSVLSMAAMDHTRSPVKLHLSSQFPLGTKSGNPRIKQRVAKVKNAADLYGEEDVFIMPRKFGGLCLPINEALSCGMPIIVSDCDPQNRWVPEELRVATTPGKVVQTRNPLRLYECDPLDLAEKIDWLYDNPEKVVEYSRWADEASEEISWTRMAPVYREVLESV